MGSTVAASFGLAVLGGLSANIGLLVKDPRSYYESLQFFIRSFVDSRPTHGSIVGLCSG